MALELRTDRLTLIALTRDQLGLYLDDPAALDRELGLPLSRDVLTERVRGAIGKKIARMAAVGEADHPWVTYWLIVTPDPPFGAGLAGFKGTPYESGEVEIGYGIDPACQGRGTMSEAVRALAAWAFAEPACRAIFAPIAVSNPASSRVMQKAGGTLYRETADTLYWHIERTGA